MFERFSDSAGRVLFVAREEAEGLGSSSIEPEHLLLALLRQPRDVMARLLEDAHVSAADLRQKVVALLPPSDPAEPEAELAFTGASQGALSYAVEEADLLRQQVHREHILLGILRCEQSAAATLLNHHGVDLQSIRKVIGLYSKTLEWPESPTDDASDRRLGTIKIVLNESYLAQLKRQIDTIQQFIAELDTNIPRDRPRPRDILANVREELNALKESLGL